MMWLGNLFRSLFLLLDSVVYWAVNIMYQLFIMISETGIFTPENIKTFGSRIYVLLGVFMLFKVSFSFINYIINPDTFTDKSKGVNKLLMNFFVVLIGIVAVPYIFQAAYSLQAIVLRENVIGSLVMGMNAEVMDNNNYDYIEQGGKLMSYTTLSAFIRLNPDVVGEECAANPVVAVTDENGKAVYENGVRKAEINPICATSDVNGALETKVKDSTVGEMLVKAYSENNTNYYTLTSLVNTTVVEDGEETWIFDYSIVLSTIAGGFLAWILLIFCIDVATRSVKLGFLQLIAPIPIISYIDPKNGKDGIFKKWTKECTGTYLSLFVRLLAIYFVLFIITIILDGGIVSVTTGDSQTNLFVKIFIIFGALMFAKDLPKLISDITGVKLDGGFTLNPLKKLGSSPYAAGAMGLVGGALGGMAANTWALGSKIKKDGWKKGLTDGFTGPRGFGHAVGNVFTGIAGAGSAGIRGAFTGFTSGGKGSLFAGAGKGIKASNQARFNRDVYAGNPEVPGSRYGWTQRRIDDINKFAGVKNKDAGVGKYDKQMKELKRQMENYQGQEHALREALTNFIPTTRFTYTDFDASKLYKYDSDGKKAKDANGHYQYVDWADYSAAGGTLDNAAFDKFKSLQTGIDYYDVEYEKLRKQYGQYEDAYKSRNAAKKD